MDRPSAPARPDPHRAARTGAPNLLSPETSVGWGPGVAGPLHTDEIPLDVELVRALVGRVMPQYADAPLRRLASSGSTNAVPS
jgi:hypothetical protein